jgi:hypothetical protein
MTSEVELDTVEDSMATSPLYIVTRVEYMYQ